MKKRRAIAALLAVMMLLSATPAMSASAAALTCPGTGGWSSMKYDDATGNTTWYMKDGSVIVQDANGNVIQNTQTSAPSAAATGWTSDTNSDLTVQPGKTYQFKFTAANPDAIKVWMGTPGVFNITKSGQESGAVYYKITAVGTPGAAAGVYVSYNGGSGTKLCVATVAGGTSSGSTSTPSAPSSGWTSDTNSDLTVQPGKTYQFKFTAANPSGINVWMGTPGVFNITKSGQESGAVYYKITAVGTPGAAAGVYVSYNGSSGTKLCVATVAGGSTGTSSGSAPSGNTSSGNTSSGNTSSGGSTSNTPDTSGMTERQKAAVEAGLTLGDWNHEYEQEVFDLVNEKREELGIPKLVWAQDGTELAQTRAKELSVKYSHIRPDGTHAGTENIGSGSAEPMLVEDPSGIHWTTWNGTPEGIVASWMGSEGHYENMMDYEVDDAGNVIGATAMAVGCYVDEEGTIWWVQVFSSSDTNHRNPIYRSPLL